jgi:hypothetical protein
MRMAPIVTVNTPTRPGVSLVSPSSSKKTSGNAFGDKADCFSVTVHKVSLGLCVDRDRT